MSLHFIRLNPFLPDRIWFSNKDLAIKSENSVSSLWYTRYPSELWNIYILLLSKRGHNDWKCRFCQGKVLASTPSHRAFESYIYLYLGDLINYQVWLALVSSSNELLILEVWGTEQSWSLPLSVKYSSFSWIHPWPLLTTINSYWVHLKTFRLPEVHPDVPLKSYLMSSLHH